jgi:hypothetical protein
MCPGEWGATAKLSTSVLDLGVEVGESASFSFLAPNILFKKPEDLLSTLLASLKVGAVTRKPDSARIRYWRPPGVRKRARLADGEAAQGLE